MGVAIRYHIGSLTLTLQDQLTIKGMLENVQNQPGTGPSSGGVLIGKRKKRILPQLNCSKRSSSNARKGEGASPSTQSSRVIIQVSLNSYVVIWDLR